MGDISIKFMVREISPRQFGRFTARLYEKGEDAKLPRHFTFSSAAYR